MCAVRCIDAPTVARVRAVMPSPADVALVAEQLRLLGDATRLQLLAALSRAEELCVCDLALILGATVSQSAVSHSLRALRQLGLVTHRRAGKVAYYRLADAAAARLVADLFASTAAARETTTLARREA